MTDSNQTKTTPTTSLSSSSTSQRVPPDIPPLPSNEKPDLKNALTKYSITNSTYFQRSFDWRSNATIQVVASLAAEVLEAFEQVPYVQVVAGLVQQIIKISDDIQSNKDRSKELVTKVMTYAKVVFDALLKLDERAAVGLRQDLEELAKVLQSVYGVLQEITGPNYASLVSRLVYRNEIASMLGEQDRSLDTTITAFQLKSAIVNRSGSERAETNQEVPMYQPPAVTASSHRVGLRAKPQIVYGRTKEIELITLSLLASRRKEGATSHDDSIQQEALPRLCILGPGGIGKTTLALSIIHHDPVVREYQESRFFVSCEAAASPDLLLNQLATCLGIAMEEVKFSFLDAVLRHLKKSDCLLVLDNFETPWDPLHTRSEIEAILSEISSLKTVTLLVTMRGSQQPAGTRWSNVVPPLQPIDLDSAISIFTSICHKKDKYAVDLIRAVDCVPLAVTLLANLAAVDGETTEALWSRWEEESTSMVENGQDRLSSLETSVQLSLNSPRIQKDVGAIHLLSTFSLLPDGVSPSTLLACENNLPEVQSIRKAISTLRQNALIYEDVNKVIRILSPIRLFMCAQHPPSNKCRSFIHEYFIALALKGNLYHDPVIRSQLQREVNNINAVLMYVLNDSKEKDLFRIIEAVISFCHFTYISGQATTQTLSKAIERLESVKYPPKVSLGHPPLSIAAPKPKKVWHRAFVGFGQSKYAKPIPTAVPLDERISSEQTRALQLRADCLGCFGQVLSRQSQFKLAREKFELAKKLHIEVGDESALAYDLLNIGLIYSREHATLQQALETITEAARLHDKLGDRTGKAYDLLGMGHVYQDLCSFGEAETQFKDAYTLFSDLGADQGQAAANYGLGTTLVSLSKCEEAATHFNEAIRLNIALGDVVGEAENLGGLATTLLLRSRFAEAHREIHKALSLRQPYEDPEHLHILGRILIAMDDCKQAKLVLERSLVIQRDIGNERGQAANLLYLGYIEFDHGSCLDARNLAEKALQIQNSSLMLAEINVLVAMIHIRRLELRKAEQLLKALNKEFFKQGSMLSSAFCYHLQAIVCLRRPRLRAAMDFLTYAHSKHMNVDNVQGYADDLSKTCEVLLARGSIEEAMILSAEALALHIEIGDRRGQGDDLFLQAAIFIAQGRLSDAENSARNALARHEAADSVYGIAKDCAVLSYIVWQQQQQQKSEVEGSTLDDQGSNACFDFIDRALSLYKRLGAVGEIHECDAHKIRMKEQKSKGVADPITVSSWVPLEEESEYDSVNWCLYSDDRAYEEDENEDGDVQKVSKSAWVPLFPVYLHNDESYTDEDDW